VPRRPSGYPAIKVLIGGTINAKRIRTQWDETLRLVTSIKHGTVTASLMLRKLSSYPRQNGFAVALREIGQIERTLFTLDWLQDVELRRRVHAGLNKGEAKNALARAVFFNRLREVCDRSFEHQRYSRERTQPRRCRHRSMEHESTSNARSRRSRTAARPSASPDAPTLAARNGVTSS
jgi:TnpA family transposase